MKPVAIIIVAFFSIKYPRTIEFILSLLFSLFFSKHRIRVNANFGDGCNLGEKHRESLCIVVIIVVMVLAAAVYSIFASG